MDNPNKSEIPKLIHFVWAGGNNPMKDDSLKVVAEWAIKNPDFKIKIWVDPKTFEGGMGKLEEYYLLQLKIAYEKEIQSSVSIEEIKQIFSLNDIRKEGICQENDKIFDHEIDRLDPNFGASSDYVRYKILAKEGGVFVDSDVRPGENKLSDLPIFNVPIGHHLFVDHLSQRAKIEHEILYKAFTIKPEPKYGTWGIGNDTFICTKNNPLMLEVIQELENNYSLPKNHKKNHIKILEMAYYGHNIEQITLGKTGPSLLHDVVMNSPLYTIPKKLVFIKKYNDILVEIKPVRCQEYKLTQPLERNTGYWLNAEPDNTQIHSIEDIYKKLFKLINEEISCYGILRLNDHVRMVKSWAQKIGTDPVLAAKQFLSIIDESSVDLEKVSIVQNISIDKDIFECCQKNGLTNKDPLLHEGNKNLFSTIYQWATSYPLFTTKMFTNNNLFNNKELINNPEATILNILDRGRLKIIFNELEIGLNFIEKIKSGTCAFQYPFKDLTMGEYPLLGAHNKYVAHIYRTLELFETCFLKAGIPQESITSAKEKLFLLCKNDMPDLFVCPITALLQRAMEERDKGVIPSAEVALRRSALKGDEQSIKSMICFMSNLDAQDATNKWSALHLACGKNHTNIGLLLIDAGSNVNLEDVNKQTPLHHAVKKNNPALVQALLLKGANPEIKDLTGKTPLQLVGNDNDLLKKIFENPKSVKTEYKF